MKTKTEERIDAGIPSAQATADSINRQATALQKEIDNPDKPMTWSKCFASDGSNTIIDVIHPLTGLTLSYGKTLEDCRKDYPDAQQMTVADFCAAKATRQDGPIEWNASDEEVYSEALDGLPPACMMGGGFLLGEPWDHHAINGQPRFAAFIKKGGKYFASSRPMTVKEFKALFVNVSAQAAAEVTA